MRAIVAGVERHPINRGVNGVACDHQGCQATLNLNRTYSWNAARAEAADHGWTFVDEKDLCPEHSA